MTPTDTHDPLRPGDAPDEIALPAFEDALWAVLRAEHGAQARPAAATSSTSTTDEVEVFDDSDGVARPPVVVPVDAGRRRHRARRGALAAAATVAVLAGIGVVASRAGDDATTTLAGPSTEAPPSPRIEEQALAVIEPIVLSTVAVEEHYQEGVLVSRTWADSRTMAARTVWYDPEGRPTGELGFSTPPGEGQDPPEEHVWVDHCARTWGTGPVDFVQSSSFDVVAKDLATSLVADGREVVDGVEMVRLRHLTDEAMAELLGDDEDAVIDRDAVRPDQLEQRVAYYLDPETLLPAAGRTTIDGEPGREFRITVQPRTAETLQQLVTTAPSDHQEMPPLEDDESFSPSFQGARSC